MNKPDFHSIYSDPLVADCAEGYFDGRRKDSPEPGTNRSPAYIHGFTNGRDDAGIPTPLNTKTTAQQRREKWAYIVASERA